MVFKPDDGSEVFGLFNNVADQSFVAAYSVGVEDPDAFEHFPFASAEFFAEQLV